MQRLFIVGGGGFAKECCQYIRILEANNKNIVLGGLLGHNGYKVDFGPFSKYFITDVADFEFGDDDCAIIGAGYPELRKKIYDDLKARNIKMPNLLTYGVYLDSECNVGEANMFIAGFCPTGNVNIGSGNVFNGDVIVGHDSDIGDFNFFGPRSQVLGGVKIGNMNQIGANAILLPKAKIGNNNKIAPLSAVYKGCKDNCYMLGNPAVKVGEVEA